MVGAVVSGAVGRRLTALRSAAKLPAASRMFSLSLRLPVPAALRVASTNAPFGSGVVTREDRAVHAVVGLGVANRDAVASHRVRGAGRHVVDGPVGRSECR